MSSAASQMRREIWHLGGGCGPVELMGGHQYRLKTPSIPINVFEKIDLTGDLAGDPPPRRKTLMGSIKYWWGHPINVLGFFDLPSPPVRIA